MWINGWSGFCRNLTKRIGPSSRTYTSFKKNKVGPWVGIVESDKPYPQSCPRKKSTVCGVLARRELAFELEWTYRGRKRFSYEDRRFLRLSDGAGAVIAVRPFPVAQCPCVSSLQKLSPKLFHVKGIEIRHIWTGSLLITRVCLLN